MTTVAPPEGLRPRIRPANRADLLAIYRIEQATFPQPWPFAALERYLGCSGFLVAHQRDVLGYIVADTVPNNGRPLGHVKDLAVTQSHRREGVGAQLLEAALSFLREQGVTATKLEVRAGNEGAMALYQQYEFEHRRTIPQYYKDGEDAFVLVRS